MSDLVIKAESLGKKYLIGHQSDRGRYTALRDVLARNVRDYWRKAKALAHGEQIVQGDEQEEIWALRDVSFEIRQGEVVGIIGRNGAGKSTLLKILSRITEPSMGRVTIRGRVASLLEVGTGFHPELTGRENIYLNGAILGMTRSEIRHKFDEIVAFAEVEKFLDTPVKRYSSGMYVRLAFAVAAHLEPEILVVDEVLAVGDAQFQKKCLGKMGEVANEGRTVLFVSHNMSSIKALCDFGILIETGKIKFFGDIDTTVNSYINSSLSYSEKKPYFETDIDPDLPIQILSISIINSDGEFAQQHPYDQPFFVNLKVYVKHLLSNVYIAVHIHDNDLTTLIFTRDFEYHENNLVKNKGLYLYTVEIPSPLLVPGIYRVSVHIAYSAPPKLIHGIDYVCEFNIIDNKSIQAKMGFPWKGKISIPLKWDCTAL